jgi:hypothetical protein
MRRRLNLLAFAVIAGGGALLGTPAPARATYVDPKLVLQSCCTAWDGWRIRYKCCSYTGCVVTASGCVSL